MQTDSDPDCFQLYVATFELTSRTGRVLDQKTRWEVRCRQHYFQRLLILGCTALQKKILSTVSGGFSFRAQLASQKMSFDVVLPEHGDTCLEYQTHCL